MGGGRRGGGGGGQAGIKEAQIPNKVLSPQMPVPNQKESKVPKAAAAAPPPPVPVPAASEKKDKNRRTCLHTQLRKTKICMYHLRGACQYSTNCAFAHTCSELQGTPDLAKTRLCKTYAATGLCTDMECTFAHGEEELRSTNSFFKKTLCMWNEKGKCRNGDQCRFAHGSPELRSNGGVPPAEQLPKSTVKASSAGTGNAMDRYMQERLLQDAAASKTAAGPAQLSNGAAAMRRKERKQQVAEEIQLQELQQQHEQLQLQLQQQLQAAVAGGLAGVGYPHQNDLGASAEPMKVKSSFADTNVVNAARYDEALKGQLDQLQKMISVLSMRCSQIQSQMDTNPFGPTLHQDPLGGSASPHLDLRLFA
jgi:hypothetical protein